MSVNGEINFNTNPNYHQIDQMDHQQLPNRTQQQLSNKTASWSQIIMIAYLYFIQGFVLSIGPTMTFIYPSLPSYSVLALFSLISIPFSFKFVSAPFIEKYNSPTYGKRKTWIIISHTICSIGIFVGSFYTTQEFAKVLAIILLLSVFFISLEDIALDALSIKQLNSPSMPSILQSTFQSFGLIFGGLVLLKLTSLQFARSLHQSQPFFEIAPILRAIAIFMFIVSFLIHFLFQQLILQKQIVFQRESIWSTIKYYKIFFDLRSKQCRMAILFLLMNQGFLLFQAGYQYELVKSGISKNDLNTLDNIISVPIIIISCFIAPLIIKIGMKGTLLICMISTQIIYAYVYFVYPTDFTRIGVMIALSSLIGTFNVIAISMMANSFPVTVVTGMIVTMLYSTSNLGRNSAIATKLTGIFGWNKLALVGLILQFLIICLLCSIYKWIEKGDVGVDGKIEDQVQQQNPI